MTTSKTSQFTPLRSPAVQLCRQAFFRSIEEGKARKLDSYDILRESHRAFREAMPHLTTAAGIRDFIACVTDGMMIDVFSATQGSKLLYAAQVASGALRNEPKAIGSPAS
ncbi:MAG TPA: hypothetical protein VGS10_03325 [Terracidiphilus sp.]|nr:hypothetical protein [Terracidiphilus sp.]